jgi:hypothetical protein
LEVRSSMFYSAGMVTIIAEYLVGLAVPGRSTYS